MKQPTLYSFGYLSTRAERIIAELIALKIPFVDIRMNPTSHNYRYTQEAFLARPNIIYRHIQALGNELYRSHSGDIKIHDMVQGRAELKTVLDEYGRCAIFCACANKNGCHRMHVATMAIVHFDAKVTHL